jgi:hypothetical protein
MITVKHPLALSAALLWIGFVVAISFMEAWLKFQAPGITLELGLGIGRLVFAALNKVEWTFAIAIIVDQVVNKSRLLRSSNSWFFIPLVLLLIQTIWILPALDARAELHLQRAPVPPSSLHFYYVGMELIKVICLVGFTIKNFIKKESYE